MTPVGGWLLVPAVFTLLCTGIGLLAEAATRKRVPGPFLPAVGLAGFIVIAGLLTIADATAELATPACAIAAAAGFALGRPWSDPRWGTAARWALGAAAIAFVVAAAPSWFSGQASVLGYIKLDDTVIWLALIEHFMAHGRDLAGIPHSTYQRTLEGWLGQAYPIGSMTPVGVTAKLTGQAYVNAYQPIVTGYVAVLALGLFGVFRELVRSPRAAALIAVIGTQASLLFGYVAWGSIKEVCVAALLPALAGVRSLPLLGLLGGGMMCVYGVGGVLFAGPALLLGLIIVVSKREWRPIPFVSGLAILVAASVPVIVVLSENSDQALHGSPSAKGDIGKLLKPLEVLQGAGLWPDGDFRYRADPHGAAVVLAVLGLLLAIAGVTVAIRRRTWTVPVLLIATLGGGAVAAWRGAPWIDAKVYAITAPMLLATGAAFLLALRPLRAFVVVLVAGCAWSSFLIFRDVYVAPRGSLVEQRALGRALDGRGPTLVLNYEGYSTRYFLAGAVDEGVSELRYSLIPDVNGNSFPNYTTAEIDDVGLPGLLAFKAIVRRTTPTGSLPPSPYRPFRAGRFFESWVRDPAAPAPLAHLPLSTGILPAARVQCAQVRALAATQGATTIVAASRENPIVADLLTGRLPLGWSDGSGLVKPATNGTAALHMKVAKAGRYRLWVGGQVLGKLDVQVDGKDVGSYRHELDAAAGYMRFAALDLTAGDHAVTLRYDRGPIWRAGRGAADAQAPLGPVALSQEVTETVQRAPVADAAKFCDARTYDWFEALP
ncbi:MAG: hypothetical protein QOF76_2625 [Solirubrobacteraceae bacterium]|nr:hypothetical protein [Solirubrobacteraceae bacterium]